MAERTAIEWAEVTWNPLAGCSVVSPGCTNCYAMREAGRRLASSAKYRGLTLGSAAGPVWTGEVRLWEPAFHADFLFSPQPKRVFVNSMSDLFHEAVPDDWIDRIIAVMVLCPQHTFQVLTKRAERMRDYLSAPATDGRIILQILDRQAMPAGLKWPFHNVWLGVSVEDQRRADERIPLLLRTPAAVRWVSAEPLLGRLDVRDWLPRTATGRHLPALRGMPIRGVDWIVVGGESGPRARPMHPDWARSLRDQCAAAGVPFFFKQWGEWAPTDRPDRFSYSQMGNGLFRLGKKAAGRLLDGREWNEYPQGPWLSGRHARIPR